MPKPIITGPTYAEMRDPLLLPENLRTAARQALSEDELNPINLFNINWKNTGSEVEKMILPKELTGVDTDRLKEEKLRGITIELGFTSLEIPGDLKVGIVDMPGHERFIDHMTVAAIAEGAQHRTQ